MAIHSQRTQRLGLLTVMDTEQVQVKENQVKGTGIYISGARQRGEDMNSAENVAYIHSQCICALAEIEGMKAENELRRMAGESPAHGEQAFMQVPAKYGIYGNAVISLFQSAW